MSFSGILGSQVVGLGGILHDVVELPLVPGDHVGRRGAAQFPRERRRGRRRDPAVVVDGAVAEHLEVLRGVPGRGVGVRLVPCVGHAHAVHRALRDAVERIRRRDAGRFEDGRNDVNDMVKLAADAAHVVDVAGPRHGHALSRPAEVRRHLLHPLERRVHRPRPGGREVREGPVGSPELVPEELVLDRHGNAIEGGELVRRAVEHAFRARAVVAADVDDQGVVELAHVLDRLDDAADFVVGVGEVGAVHVGLLDEELFLIPTEGIPLRQFLRPGSQLGVLGHDAQPLLVGEDGLAQLVPAAVEQVHVADLLDPLRRRMMRGVRAARYVIDKERLVGRDLLDLLHVLDRLVGHGRGQVPAWFALEGIDGRRIAVQVRLPLAGVAADEAVEVLEAHAVRPLVEGPGLGRLIEGRVVILAEPRGRVPVVLQDGADGAVLLPDDRVVARKPRRDFAHHAEAGHVVVAPGDQCRARRRAERRGVKIRVAQPALRDAIQCRGRNDAAERARRAEADVVRHDEQHVGRALRRHDAWRPPGFRLRGLFLDHPAELRIGRRQLVAADGRRSSRRAWRAGDFHGLGKRSCRHRDGSQHSAQEFVYFGSHDFFLSSLL